MGIRRGARRPATPKERLEKSLQTLRMAGGRQLSVRLDPQANQALKTLMKQGEYETVTQCVNAMLLKSAGRRA